jgi:peptidoglycan/xylan/chitin deacetylase (PgdA/CDA1 family)
VNSQRFNANGLITGKSNAVLEEAHRRGHLIGNHTHSHPLLPGLSAEKQRREIELTDRAIEELLGTPSFLFRPPFGAMSPYAAQLLKKRGSVVVMWNLGSDDDKNFNVGKVVNTLMRKLERQGGGIVLMHDTHYWTIESVPALLRAIQVESCRLLAEGEEPYEVVGLEYFYQPRSGPTRVRGAEEHRAWLRRRAALAERCSRGPTAAVPEFLRGESP